MEVLIDVREPAEYAGGHLAGAMNLPLGQVDEALPNLAEACRGGTLRFVCKSGMRAEEARKRFLARFPDLSDKVSAGAGENDAPAASGPIPLMRQVLIAAGSLVAGFGVAAVYAHPAWIWGAIAVGGGMVFAGTTGICGMALLLQKMPWNQRAAGPS